MRFLIVTAWSEYYYECEDFGAAADHAWDDRTGYRDVKAIVRCPEDEGMKDEGSV